MRMIMNQHNADVCPWRYAYLFDNPFRRLLHDPVKLLSSYVKPGMTVADFGCGMGFFSIAMAKLVGETGKVYSVDIQTEMHHVLQKRAQKKLPANVAKIIHPILATSNDLGLDVKLDFALSFWMVHETPDFREYIRSVAYLLVPGGHYLIAEPRHHVQLPEWQKTIDSGIGAGLKYLCDVKARGSYAGVFLK